MNKQIDDIKFFTENLGVSEYPVVDLSGSLLSNALALVGLYSQAELEMCAQYLKGKVMAFEKTIDGKFMMLQQRSAQNFADENLNYKGIMARGVLVELTA